MHHLSRFLICVLLCGSSFASDGRFLRLDPVIVNRRLQLAPSALNERLAMVRSGFENAGCTSAQITEQVVPGETLPNIYCTLPGKGEGTIVVAASLGYRSKGKELSVDSATLNLLPLLAQSLYSGSRTYTLVFVAFAGDNHRQGSSSYLSQLSDAQRKAIRGMVFLDHLGRSPARYLFPSQFGDPTIYIASREVEETQWRSKMPLHDDNALRKQFSLAAKAVKMDDPNELDEFYFTDALNFEHERIMALSLTSPAYSIIVRDYGRREVKMPRTEVDLRVYYETYNLLCVYLLYLDNSLNPSK